MESRAVLLPIPAIVPIGCPTPGSPQAGRPMPKACRMRHTFSTREFMPSDTVGDASRRMTYAELADVRGISVTSARRLVLRHHWPRQTGNDGIVRVTVPLTALANAVARKANGVATTSPSTVAVTSERV